MNAETMQGLQDLAGRRVLVTGGLGFLGLNLVPPLLAAGARVRLLNRSLEPLALSWLERLAAGREVEVIQGDIADPERMPGWLANIDLVLNLAGESGAVKSTQHAETDMQVNIAGHLNLLNALRALAAPPRAVFVSSRLVYGITGAAPVSEEHPPQPTSLYGLHKLTVEHYHRIYRRHYGIPFTVLRVTNPYGPYQLPQRHHYGILNRFVMAALRGETIPLFGGGPQLRDYLHVADVAEAILRAGLHPEADGETLNVGAGVSHRLGEVARLVVAIAGSGRTAEVPWPEGHEKVETGDFLCDVRRCERLLGWQPRIGLEEGLCATVRDYRELLA
jgi:UDP-glucose 4-epimerase